MNGCKAKSTRGSAAHDPRPLVEITKKEIITPQEYAQECLELSKEQENVNVLELKPAQDLCLLSDDTCADDCRDVITAAVDGAGNASNASNISNAGNASGVFAKIDDNSASVAAIGGDSTSAASFDDSNVCGKKAIELAMDDVVSESGEHKENGSVHNALLQAKTVVFKAEQIETDDRSAPKNEGISKSSNNDDSLATSSANNYFTIF